MPLLVEAWLVRSVAVQIAIATISGSQYSIADFLGGGCWPYGTYGPPCVALQAASKSSSAD